MKRIYFRTYYCCYSNSSFVNVNEVSNEKKLTSLIEIEALATNEWNDWNQWFS